MFNKSNRLINSIKSIVLVFVEYLVLMIAIQSIFEWLKPDKYAPLTNNDNLYVFLISIALVIIITVLMTVNSVQHRISQIKKIEGDIISVDKTCNILIEKATKLADKYRDDEVQVATSPVVRKITNADDLKIFLHDRPELKANEHTSKLLDQLERTEDLRLRTRQLYSSAVSAYNEEINSFPALFLKNLFAWEEVDMKLILKDDELVKDEDLGI